MRWDLVQRLGDFGQPDGLDILTCPALPLSIKASERLVVILAPPRFSIKQVFRSLNTRNSPSRMSTSREAQVGVSISDEKGYTIG